MFRSQSMCKVEIVVPERDIIAVTEALAKTNTLHIGGLPDSVSEVDFSQSGEWQKDERHCAALEQRLRNLMTALDVVEGAVPDEPLHWINLDLAERDIESMEHEASDPVQRLHMAHDKLTELESVREQLTPLIKLDIDLQNFRDAQYIFSMFGFMPMNNVVRLRTSLEQTPSMLAVFGEKGQLASVGLFGLMRDTDVLRRAARSAYLNPINVPEEYRGTPLQIVNALDASIQRTREQIAAYQSELHVLQEVRIRRMQHLLWRLRVSHHIIKTITGFRKFKFTYLISGWVPEPEVDTVKRSVAASSNHGVVNVSTLRLEDRPQVPFFFHNPPLIHQFEQLVTTYSYPAYNELDPTPLLAFTFPLIFGVMFGDVGHGLLLLLLGLLLISKRIKSLAGLAQVGGIVITCGATSMLFGALYGIITLSLGMVFNIVGCLQRQELGRALFSKAGLAGLLFYWSLVGFGVKLISPKIVISNDLLIPLSVISALGITFAGVLESLVAGYSVNRSDLGMTLMEGFFELFESVISLLSNTLSYVRMGAFAVAHGALSLVVFILAEIVSPGHGLGYWVVVALGNIFIIGFEGMIVAIQTLRLEYYELFSKFFTGGGVRYSPLGILPAD
jgi:V/A-type H+-transporting ATPase subunit I